jgi:hypothetical protein
VIVDSPQRPLSSQEKLHVSQKKRCQRAEEDLPGVSVQHRRKTMWGQVGQLYAYHGDVPAQVRPLTLTEEVGEVADAIIGMHGLNARKGVCRPRDDLLDELADVIITAAVAMSGVTGDVGRGPHSPRRRLAAVTERAGL